MSNTFLVRPMRPLSASISGSLRCGAATTTTSTAATKPSTTTTSPSPMPLTQRRHESTTRRQSNRLRSVPTAPSSTPSSGHTSDHIVFNPPSSAPSVYHTPLKFLPAGDRRRELYALTSRLAAPASSSSAASPIARTGTALAAGAHASPSILPPHLAHAAASSNSPLPAPVRQPYAKKYHLTETDIAEIRRLRAQDPAHWTRERLAAKFECSQFFVGLVAPAPEHAVRKAAEVDEVKRGWGRRKREAREDRRRRRETWGQDA
ncbi:54S ribosomal protein L20, mitochondrial [Botryosphaeria dothidea]|uniref:54S ribosomal protein L20, mitochondrial n=1 Tax=Botryosphaeria dothidea TaxID=55169 RepID=A0A8H4N168_9PEZI|nr:54S ribosomal protein L20, mitochondrial [Botryosphaeria dothidea]